MAAIRLTGLVDFLGEASLVIGPIYGLGSPCTNFDRTNHDRDRSSVDHVPDLDESSLDHVATSAVTGDRTASQTFRPDIQGLRAIAVILVILAHASVPGFEGGYVGVDVFFVISGFVITSLLRRQPPRRRAQQPRVLLRPPHSTHRARGHADAGRHDVRGVLPARHELRAAVARRRALGLALLRELSTDPHGQ